MTRKDRLIDIADTLDKNRLYQDREMMLLVKCRYGVTEQTAIAYVEDMKMMGILKVVGNRHVRLDYDRFLEEVIKPKT